jgi:uncharacterized membrane protein
MNPSEVLLLAFLIGVIAGLRSLTASAAVAWAAHRGLLNLHNSPLSFLETIYAAVFFILLAVGELVNDKRASTPNRTSLPGLIPRILFGGLCGAGIAIAGTQSIALGALLGVVGSIAGAFAGYQVRKRLVQALKVPDLVIALAEDAVTIAGGIFIVTRF